LITSDEYNGHPAAIKEVLGTVVTLPRTGKPGRPAGPRVAMPEGLNYATVNKTRQKGRVSAVATRVVLGSLTAAPALVLLRAVQIPNKHWIYEVRSWRCATPVTMGR
jgi:hypothetical protein